MGVKRPPCTVSGQVAGTGPCTAWSGLGELLKHIFRFASPLGSDPARQLPTSAKVRGGGREETSSCSRMPRLALTCLMGTEMAKGWDRSFPQCWRQNQGGSGPEVGSCLRPRMSSDSDRRCPVWRGEGSSSRADAQRGKVLGAGTGGRRGGGRWMHGPAEKDCPGMQSPPAGGGTWAW